MAAGEIYVSGEFLFYEDDQGTLFRYYGLETGATGEPGEVFITSNGLIFNDANGVTRRIPDESRGTTNGFPDGTTFIEDGSNRIAFNRGGSGFETYTQPHVNGHSDLAFQNAHSNISFQNSHSNRSFQNLGFQNSHSNRSHINTGFQNSHSNSYSNGGYHSNRYFNSHSNRSHSNRSFQNSHSNRSHSNRSFQNSHSNRAFDNAHSNRSFQNTHSNVDPNPINPE